MMVGGWGDGIDDHVEEVSHLKLEFKYFQLGSPPADDDDNDDGNDGNDDCNDDNDDGNVQEVSRLRQEAQYFRLGGLLAQLTETGPRLGVDGS